MAVARASPTRSRSAVRGPGERDAVGGRRGLVRRRGVGRGRAGKADVFVAVSRDGGATFGPPVQVNASAGEARLGGEIAAARRAAAANRRGRSGDRRALERARTAPRRSRRARSRDGGRTFDAAVTLQAPGPPAIAAGRRWRSTRRARRTPSGWIIAGMAAGKTRRRARAAQGRSTTAWRWRRGPASTTRDAGRARRERELAAGVCYCCKTALAPARRRLYAAWRHVYPGNLRDIAFTCRATAASRSPAGARERRRLGDQRLPRRRPGDGGGRGRHGAHRVADGHRRRRGRAVLRLLARRPHVLTPVRIPTLGSPKPSHPQIVVDATGGVVVAGMNRGWPAGRRGSAGSDRVFTCRHVR